MHSTFLRRIAERYCQKEFGKSLDEMGDVDTARSMVSQRLMEKARRKQAKILIWASIGFVLFAAISVVCYMAGWV